MISSQLKIVSCQTLKLIYCGHISSLLLQIVEKKCRNEFWCHLSNNWRPDVACINWNDFDPRHNLDPTQWDELFFQNSTSKGLFTIFNYPKKLAKKVDFTTVWYVPQVELFSFDFWENWRHQRDISKLTDIFLKDFTRLMQHSY